MEEVTEDKGKRETEGDKRYRGKGERDRKKRGTEGGRKRGGEIERWGEAQGVFKRLRCAHADPTSDFFLFL